MSSRTWSVLVAGGALLLACARPVPPTGGPIDDSPPTVAGTSPSLYETAVSIDAPLVIAFSEPMHRGRVLDELIVRPYVDWGRHTWRGDTLEIRPRDGWAAETTYTVLLRRGMSDRRDNRLPEPGLIVFSTGDDVARGAIAGRLERIGVSQGEVLMLAFVTPNGDTTRIDPEMAVSAGEPDGAGSFLVPGLDVGHAYEIGVWFDIDEDRVFDEGQDLYARALAPVTPDSTGGPTDVRVVLVFADEPGDLTGVVVDSTCAALAVLRQRLAAQADSALAARDSLAARRTTLAASADSLFGLAVAPDGGGSPADTLRQRAERLRAEAAAIVVPDSAAILARRHLPAAALADSLYCSRPVIARFVAAVGDSGILEQRLRTPDGAFRIEDVAPGAYRGAVWRDVEGDGAFAPEEEPGRADIDVWVPPGQEGRVDTLRIGRPAPDPTGGER